MRGELEENIWIIALTRVTQLIWILLLSHLWTGGESAREKENILAGATYSLKLMNQKHRLQEREQKASNY